MAAEGDGRSFGLIGSRTIILNLIIIRIMTTAIHLVSLGLAGPVRDQGTRGPGDRGTGADDRTRGRLLNAVQVSSVGVWGGGKGSCCRGNGMLTSLEASLVLFMKSEVSVP